MKRKARCYKCKKVFKMANSDRQLEKQLKKEFPDKYKEECTLVCENCFKEMFG